MTKTVAWIAPAAKQEFVRQEVDLGPPGDKEVEVAVEHCSLCHSGLSVLNNEWSFSQFSTVLGHEVTGVLWRPVRLPKESRLVNEWTSVWTSSSQMHGRWKYATL